MGKGDKKTAKGKRVMGSYGNSRKKKTATAIKPAVKAEKEVAPAKKAPAKKAAAPKAAAEKKPAAKKTTTKRKQKNK